MIRGEKLRSVGIMAEILGMEGLHSLGFDIPSGKLMVRQAVMLSRVEENLLLHLVWLSQMTESSKKLQRMQQKAWRISLSNSSVNAQRIFPCENS